MDDTIAHEESRGSEDRLAAMEARIARLETEMALLIGFKRDAVTTDAALWSASGFPVLTKGIVVTTETAEAFGRFLASGWWNMEGWGVWGRDQQHAIRFHIQDYRGGYVDMFLNLQAFLPSDSDPLEVHITANGVFLGRYDVRAVPQTIRLRLPSVAIGHGDVILYLQCNEPKSPATFGESKDRRMLGAGLIALGLY
ncbi:hypothetical protein V473_03170 [Sphingobium cupriresistens LL01]|uniref:Uncharacterized protein n=1 Tax=Sphingobium cupriresistens LL01 TaxID=1420583 RepID=A0A0J8AX10_9SPHN|nr:hypothetical protein V473_03170 [Sphingobium cupriresistens LL01]